MAAANSGWISINELQAGILQRSLQQTFVDAVQIARFCKIEYIWIDCLCIIQDQDINGNNPDWDAEAANMGAIYAGGVLYVAFLTEPSQIMCIMEID